MILQSTISQVIESQKENISKRGRGLKREALDQLPDISSLALIVSGIRRCGKSTLLFQLLTSNYPEALYLNFEDPRFYEFEPSDFLRLDEAISRGGYKELLLDEIQIIPQWESYVRQKLDEGLKVLITGSNASLLSRELGSKLTGRHVTKELFPFSFIEFCRFKELNLDKVSLLKYMQTGGVPEYVKQEISDILNQLFEDILTRDIAVRYGVRDIRTLQRLAFYLLSNVGSRITGTRLKSLFEMGSTSTVMEYLSHLELSYLLYFVPKFSYSHRKQLINPRKVYAVDTGLINVNSGSFSSDDGRIFENLVFLHLRRKYLEIFYYAEKGECDFIVFHNHAFQSAIQVCFELNRDNLNREINGLLEAMEFFSTEEGTIVTLNQTEKIIREGRTIHVIPAYEYFLN